MPPLEGISGAGCFQEIIDCLIECFRMPVCHKVVSFQDHHPGARDVFAIFLVCASRITSRVPQMTSVGALIAARSDGSINGSFGISG